MAGQSIADMVPPAPGGDDPWAAAAYRQQQAVRPWGGRQEGGLTNPPVGEATDQAFDMWGRVASGAANRFAHMPQQAFEASEAMRQGYGYDPAPIMEAAGSALGWSMPFAKPGAAGAMGGKLAQPEGIRAYHGSPHDFDRFDLSKIGTGEGAQSYGHGLYFAGTPQTAEFYKKTLATKGLDDIGQVAHQALLAHWGNSEKAAAALRERAAAETADNFSGVPPQLFLDAAKVAERGEMPKGHMYEININAKPEQFLDWDKPLIEQGGQVPDAFKRITGMDLLPPTEAARAPDAGQFVRSMGRMMSPERVSQTLNEAGIPGIRYLDQGSRHVVRDPAREQTLRDHIAALEQHRPSEYNDQVLARLRSTLASYEGPRTSNYVVFNDQIIDILRKYGIAGLGALPPAMLSQMQQPAQVAQPQQ